MTGDGTMDVLTAMKASKKVLRLRDFTDPYESLGRANLLLREEITRSKLDIDVRLVEDPTVETTRIIDAIYRAKAIKRNSMASLFETPIPITTAASPDWDDVEEDEV